MWNAPSDEELRQLPRLYDTENQSLEEKVVHMHFFLWGCDWYSAEYCPDDRVFFGYAILHDDHANAEWGYFSLDEMLSIRTAQGLEIDRDLHWTPKAASEIERIRGPPAP